MPWFAEEQDSRDCSTDAPFQICHDKMKNKTGLFNRDGEEKKITDK